MTSQTESHQRPNLLRESGTFGAASLVWLYGSTESKKARILVSEQADRLDILAGTGNIFSGAILSIAKNNSSRLHDVFESDEPLGFAPRPWWVEQGLTPTSTAATLIDYSRETDTGTVEGMAYAVCSSLANYERAEDTVNLPSGDLVIFDTDVVRGNSIVSLTQIEHSSGVSVLGHKAFDASRGTTIWPFNNYLSRMITSLIIDVENEADLANLEEIIEIPDAPGQRHESVIKNKGVPVWSIVAYVKDRGLSEDQVSQEWSGYITPVEVRAAVRYQEAFPDRVVDPRLQQEDEEW